MPLNSNEARQAYDSLAATLREQGLEWVLEQVVSTISGGKPAPKEILVATFETTVSKNPEQEQGSIFSDYPTNSPRKRGRKEVRETTEPFTEQDELLILLDAIGHGLAVPAAFTAESFRILADTHVSVDEIVFASDRDIEPHIHSKAEALSLSHEASRLSVLLAEARRAI
jgi:hypothetical protein